MSKKTRSKRFFAGLGIMALVLILGYLVIRPFHLRWGAAPAEVSASMPGDLEQIGWTRAVTIAAAPEEIWPWLAQWGQGRGGWYSYDWIENILGFDIHTAYTILPQYQDTAVGTPICMSRSFCPSKVSTIEPYRWLSWQALDDSGVPVWTYTFGLERVDASHTRLLVRESFNNAFMPPPAVVALEIPDAVMELKALNTVKALSEGHTPSVFVIPLEILAWFAALVIGLDALVLFANRRKGNGLLAVCIASVVVLLLITFLFPPLWLRFLLDLGLLAGLLWARRRSVRLV
jgi:hypothetical protein